MMKTKEELNALKNEVENLNKKLAELTDEELTQVCGGTDTESLRISGKPVPLPEARYKKESEGGYAGNTVPDQPKL